jgi:hypothetical protein
MTVIDQFVEVVPALTATVPTAAQVAGGIPIPPVRLLQVMSPEEWESFTSECLSYHKVQGTYHSIRKYSGAGDLGLDVVAFTTANGFAEPWDSYQCKHYDHPLTPLDVLAEVAKVIYHSFLQTPPFNQVCRVPRAHFFVAPHGVGITVGRWLKDPARFKEDVRQRWNDDCAPKIGKNVQALLTGALLAYFNVFDFSIFADRSGPELIEDHSKTIFYASRFGGGFPLREEPARPPHEPTNAESLYLRKLLNAYASHLGHAVHSAGDLGSLEDHYNRQRVLFYSAESLRNFARDRTPPRTFVDTCESPHADGLGRLRATLQVAAAVDASGNALSSVTRVADKQGICHQLANDDRLTWINDND